MKSLLLCLLLSLVLNELCAKDDHPQAATVLFPGHGVREQNQRHHTPEYQRVLVSLKELLNVDVELNSLRLEAFNQFSKNQYFVIFRSKPSVVYVNDEVIDCSSSRKREQYKDLACENFEVIGSYNPKANTFKPISSPFSDYPIRTLYTKRRVRESYVYGCNQDYPLQKIDMDFDGKPELWFIGGRGKYYMDGEFDFTNYVLMFSTENLEQPLFFSEIVRILSSPMHQETIYYSPAARVGNYNRKTHKITTAADVGPAKRMYTKFYVGDFNENKKADLIVWKRHYQSRLQTTKKPGYEFTHESFELHEIHEGKYKQLDLKQEEIKSLFKKHGLSWRKGLPNVNRCQYMKPDDAMIMTQDFDSEVIDDPVLKQ